MGSVDVPRALRAQFSSSAWGGASGRGLRSSGWAPATKCLSRVSFYSQHRWKHWAALNFANEEKIESVCVHRVHEYFCQIYLVFSSSSQRICVK